MKTQKSLQKVFLRTSTTNFHHFELNFELKRWKENQMKIYYQELKLKGEFSKFGQPRFFLIATKYSSQTPNQDHANQNNYRNYNKAIKRRQPRISWN